MKARDACRPYETCFVLYARVCSMQCAKAHCASSLQCTFRLCECNQNIDRRRMGERGERENHIFVNCILSGINEAFECTDDCSI